ncbi:MAG: amidohydrolase family protein [Pseudomonadota bacterium]|nr:amidohydrolase family protein [Pseudomonadota bacterium]
MHKSEHCKNPLRTVDVDGHVLEPRNTWKEYLERKYRNRSIEFAMEDSGEVLLVDGNPLEVVRNRTALLGGIDSDPEVLLRGGKKLVYEDGCPPGSYLPAERLKVMDREGIDISLLYPTVGICWEGKTNDGELAAAYTRAYNRWLVDFCSYNRQRLIPIAHISLLDPGLAVKEIKRAAKDGCKGIFLSPDLKSRGMRHFDHPELRKVWATAQDLSLPVSFHVVVRDERSHSYFDPKGEKAYRFGLFDFSFLAIDVMAAFTEFLSLGLLEQYPSLKVAILESGANWISAWLDRMDHKFEVVRSTTTLTKKPSDYFFRQCIVSADPDETLTGAIVNHMGDDYFVWASDYPHVDASYGVLNEIKKNLAGISRESKRKVLGDNAIRFYGLS